MPTPTSVLVVDDHPLMRKALGSVAGPLVGGEVREAGTKLEALAALRSGAVSLLLLDVMLPDVNGFDFLRDVRSEFPRTRVVIVSAHDDDEFRARARASGADGFIGKGAPEMILRAELQRVLGGAESPPPRLQGRTDPVQGLSARELSVFQLVGRGRSTREIAAALGISFKTVEAHKENIKLKLGLQGAGALAQQAAVWVSERR